MGQYTTYDQYIGCLKDTKKFDDITRVECFETEKDLLEGFIREINTQDCDIITGYNIFFFDEKYMYERSLHPNINCQKLFSKLIYIYKCHYHLIQKVKY